MHSGQAYLHRFPEDEKPHLWFVLSEPQGYFLAVCLSMTSSHFAGEQVIKIPPNTILTDGTSSRGGFVTDDDHDSTLFITGPKLMNAAALAEVFTDSNCCGAIKPKWLRAIRRAVTDGLRFVRNPQIRTDIAVIAAGWETGDDQD